MRLPPYPRYKPSGVEWVGEVPEHWEVKSLTRLTRSIRNGTSVTQIEEEVETAVPVTRIESISGGAINFEKVGLVEWTPYLEAYRLNRGDILMSHINSLSMVGNCAVYDSARPLFSGMNLLRIQPEPHVNPHWLWRALSCDGIRKEISSRAKPAINQASVTTNQVKSLGLPVPPLPEQRAIADFLDRKTAKIDTLVAKKRTLIERLKEKRTALISRTVTRGLPPAAARAAGLDPHPKLKPSGIDWLGDVPEHWEMTRGRFAMDVNPRSTRIRALRPEDEVSFVPMEAVGEYGGLNLEQTRAISDIGSGYTEFDDGDVVVAKITPCFENGKGALASGLMNGAAFGTTELHVLRAGSKLERRFLFYFTVSRLFRNTGEGEMYGAGGQKRVPPEFCENFRIPLPPIGEQRAIADFLDRETAKIDDMVAKIETAIERLQEYRTALITAAVTGKIDVRGAAA